MPKKATTKKTATKNKATTRKRATSKKSTNPGQVSLAEDQIRDRAYEIYRAGRNPSNPDADWLQAEQELRSGRAS